MTSINIAVDYEALILLKQTKQVFQSSNGDFEASQNSRQTTFNRQRMRACERERELKTEARPSRGCSNFASTSRGLPPRQEVNRWCSSAHSTCLKVDVVGGVDRGGHPVDGVRYGHSSS